MIRFYYGSGSPVSWRVQLSREEKGLAYEPVLLSFEKGEHKSPEHLARSPHGKVPALEDDGVSLYESSAIVEYLEERYPRTPLLPPDPAERARVRIEELECLLCSTSRSASSRSRGRSSSRRPTSATRRRSRRRGRRSAGSSASSRRGRPAARANTSWARCRAPTSPGSPSSRSRRAPAPTSSAARRRGSSTGAPECGRGRATSGAIRRTGGRSSSAPGVPHAEDRGRRRHRGEEPERVLEDRVHVARGEAGHRVARHHHLIARVHRVEDEVRDCDV